VEQIMLIPALLGKLAADVERMYPGIKMTITESGRTVWQLDSLIQPGDISAWTDVSISFWPMPDMEDIYRRYAALINHKRPRKISWRRLNRRQRKRAVKLHESGRL
jgi:hypothetical protein